MVGESLTFFKLFHSRFNCGAREINGRVFSNEKETAKVFNTFVSKNLI